MTISPSDASPRRDVFRTVHVGALVLCAVMLPWSKALLSLSLLLLVANWLIGGLVQREFGARFKRAFLHPSPLLFIAFFMLHIVGLLWTSERTWGLDLVRILSPVLALGAVLGGSKRLTALELRTILLFGAWSVVVSTFACLLLRSGASDDYRALSVFVSHIRLALLLCMAIAVFALDGQSPRALRMAGYLAACWALYFINRLASIQGYFIVLIIAACLTWRWAGARSSAVRWGLRGGLVIIPMIILAWIWTTVRESYRLPDPATIAKFERTAGGEYYQHDITNPQMENGNHVWMYVAMGELKRGWGRRSERSLDDKDDKGHFIWSTLVRYMASKGLRKDSVSFHVLTEADIRAVERGVANADPQVQGGLGGRFQEVIFELQQYYAMGAVDGHSVAMRLEYLRVGWRIARENWLFGVGTGDTQAAFDRQYEAMGSRLSPEWRHRAHNEYLTLWISFGIAGLAFCLFSWLWPAHQLHAWRRPHFVAWAIIFGISCITDDTIETQVGATFFAFYYALLVFAAPVINQPEAPAAKPTRAVG